MQFGKLIISENFLEKLSLNRQYHIPSIIKIRLRGDIWNDIRAYIGCSHLIIILDLNKLLNILRSHLTNKSIL